jgi:hypothetical protein
MAGLVQDSQRRGRITALFMTAVAVSGVIGSPLSG